MPVILTRVLVATITYFAVGGMMPKSHPADRNAPVQITVSRNGALETFEVLPGKVKVDGQTFKIWRNTLILCDRDVKKGKCHLPS